MHTLVSHILPTLPNGGPILLAAGGVANGRQVASLLTSGAHGVVMGTRFLLTNESSYTAAQKYALVSASCNDTVRTMAFDVMRGTTGWPAGVDGRALKNETVDDYNLGLDLVDVKERFSTGVKEEDPKRMLVWSGNGVHLMDRIQGAKVSI